MKKIFITITIVFAIVVGMYYLSTFSSAKRTKIIPQYISLVFDQNKKEIAKTEQDIQKLEQAEPRDEEVIKQLQFKLGFHKYIDTLTTKNLEALKKEQDYRGILMLHTQDLRDAVGDALAKEMIGDINIIMSRWFDSGNVLAYVLLYSALDNTKEDQDKTLEVLKFLIAKKGLPVNAEVQEILWVKHDPASEQTFDYRSQHSLPEYAITYSFPAALELLLEYKAPYNKDQVNKILEKKDILHPEYIDEFKRIFQKYDTQ